MNKEQVAQARAAVAEPNGSSVGPLSPVEWADLIGEVPAYEKPMILDQVPDDLIPEVVAKLDIHSAADLVRRVPDEDAAALLRDLDDNRIADILALLPTDTSDQILAQLGAEPARRLHQLMSYPPDSAGGRMRQVYVSVPGHLRVEDAISHIRQLADRIRRVYYVYVVDDDGRYLGILPLQDVMVAPAETELCDLLPDDSVSVRVDADEHDAARALIRHDLLAVPVVDADGCLVGSITHRDIAEVVREENTRQIERMGGSQPLQKPYPRAGVFLLFRKRIIWLLALFVAEAYTGTVMRFFEDTLDQVVALAFFVPLLIGTGGNIGSQITTTLIRAMATGEVALRDARRVLFKETGVGLVIGGTMAIVAFGRAELLGVGVDVSLVVALTIAAISIWSAAVASMLPLMLEQLKLDPTVVSAPFITTLVDGTGLIIYFMIAKVILGV